ncbi:MAG: OmpA family protein [Candidatus Muiribacteriaceae bacterium]
MRKKHKCPPGLAPWVLTFGDCMTLLLTFFVLLFSMSSIDVAKFQQIIEAFQGAFGVLQGGDVISHGNLKRAKETTKPTQMMSREKEKKKIEEQVEKIERMQESLNEIEKKSADELKPEVKKVKMEAAELKEQLKTGKTEKEFDEMMEEIENDSDYLRYQELIKKLAQLQKELKQKFDQNELFFIDDQGRKQQMDIEVKLEERGLVIRVQDTALFDFGRASLTPQAKTLLEQLSDALATVDNKIEIQGHTDDKKFRPGSRYKDNWELSTERALSVLRYLNKEGIAAQKMAAAGFGEYRPIAKNKIENDRGILIDNPEGRARNRRVDIVVLKE